MELHCHKCHHSWDEDVDDATPVVQCPECMVVVPVVLAKEKPTGPPHAAPPTPGPAIPRPHTPRPDTPDPNVLRRPLHGDEVGDETNVMPGGGHAPVARRPAPRPAFDENETNLMGRAGGAPPTSSVPPKKKFGFGGGLAGAIDELDKTFPIGEEPDEEDVVPKLPPRRQVDIETRVPTGRRGTPSSEGIGYETDVMGRSSPGGRTAPTIPTAGGGGSSHAPVARRPLPPIARDVDEDEDIDFHSNETLPGGRSSSAPGGVSGGRSDSVFEAPSKPAHRRGRAVAHEGDTVDADAQSDPFAQDTIAGGSSGDVSGHSSSSASERIRGVKPKEIDLTGEKIGGYVVRRMLGAGGMGAVCLARQVSLDRDIALKILPGGMASNPELLARFTREALSAAQLTHHNIVQVYDVGSVDDLHYISMEYVRGDNLGTMVKEHGRLEPDDAAGYILQAARGLKYAHDRGIIHRDIKPDNLMVNDQGIVKIADMGLAKMRGEIESRSRKSMISRRETLNEPLNADLTLHDVAMGTPAYMAPEQGRDASGVDHRADQYSLGCTLYYLIGGRAPYSGTTVNEIITKHQTEPPPPLELIVRHVPHTLNTIIHRMLEKDPKARYPTMAECIHDLEAYLGVESEKGPYTPREQHMQLLEREVSEYYAAPGIRRRRMAVLGFVALMPVVILLAHWIIGEPFVIRGLIGVYFLTPLAGFILNGIRNKTYLFRRVRSVFFGMTLRGWLMTVLGSTVAVAGLWITGMLLEWLAFAILAVVLAYVYQSKVYRHLRQQREPGVEKVQKMLRELRVRGVSEDALQDFVYRFSGEHWEEFFEEVFGYEAMIYARARWAAADQVRPRKRFATWRDPVARALTQIEDMRKRRRERRQLAKVEAQRLKAEGVSESDAARQASMLASQIMHQGLLPLTDAVLADIAGPTKIEIRTDKTNYIALVAQLVRLALGGALLAVWQLKHFDVFELPLPENVSLIVHSWWGLGVGVVLFLSAFSSRVIPPFLVVLGSVMILGSKYLVPLVNQPQFPESTCLYAGAALALAGLGLSFLYKLSGEKF